MRELCRLGALSLRPSHQRLAEQLFPLSQRIPDVAVGGAQQFRGSANGTTLHDRREKREKRIVEHRPGWLDGLERVSETYAERAGCGDARFSAARPRSGRTGNL